MTDLVWKPYPGHSDPVLFDARGHRRTGSLFLETTQDTNREPVLQLKDYDGKYPSAYILYMESVDEYDAAMKLVGSMSHWRKLLSCSWFMNGDPKVNFPGLNTWREDMKARDANLAKRVLMDKVKNDDDRQAAQYLMNYATKGDTAGLKPKKVKAAPARRGAQNSNGVIDLDARFEKLTQDNI